ncbi:hypothetical protein EMIT0P74_100124 [Pseudomonas sp. IT-P74]
MHTPDTLQARHWFEKTLLWHTTTLRLLVLAVVHIPIQGLNNLLIKSPPKLLDQDDSQGGAVHAKPVRYCLLRHPEQRRGPRHVVCRQWQNPGLFRRQPFQPGQ